MLRRTKCGKAFLYALVMSRDEYQARIVVATIGPLLYQAPEPILSAFVEVAARAGARHLSMLARLIRARRGRRG